MLQNQKSRFAFVLFCLSFTTAASAGEACPKAAEGLVGRGPRELISTVDPSEPRLPVDAPVKPPERTPEENNARARNPRIAGRADEIPYFVDQNDIYRELRKRRNKYATVVLRNGESHTGFLRRVTPGGIGLELNDGVGDWSIDEIDHVSHAQRPGNERVRNHVTRVKPPHVKGKNETKTRNRDLDPTLARGKMNAKEAAEEVFELLKVAAGSQQDVIITLDGGATFNGKVKKVSPERVEIEMADGQTTTWKTRDIDDVADDPLK